MFKKLLIFAAQKHLNPKNHEKSTLPFVVSFAAMLRHGARVG
jgi:hypothetical protein